MPHSWISQLIQIRSIGASDTSRQDISCDPRKLGVARPFHRPFLCGLGWIATLPAAIRLAEKRFTGESAEIVLGWITAVYQIGGALSAYVAGIMRTDLGTYFQVFMLSGLLCFLASMLVLFVRREGSPTSAPSS